MDDNVTVDVEAIIEEIRKKAAAAGAPEPPQAGEPVHPPSLHHDLQVVHKTYDGSSVGQSGPIPAMRRIIYRVLGLKHFHGRLVSIITRLTGILEGANIPESVEISANHRRSINLMEHFSKRLDEYDEMDLEKRLKAIEEHIKQVNTPDKT